MVRLTPDTYESDSLYPRVAKAMREILASGLPVSAPAVFERMGMLSNASIEAWRRGEVPYLERVIMGSLSKLNRVVRIIALHAHDLNLPPAPPHAAGPIKFKRRPLQFSKTGEARLEAAYKRVFYPRRVPARRQAVVAFGARANHCAFHPMSSTTVDAHRDELGAGEVRHEQGHDPLPRGGSPPGGRS